MESHVVDVTLENAQAVLIEESLNRPVVVCFWAESCSTCKGLLPILEKVTNEYAGDFLLAKVDTDEAGQIAGQFGVQSLPTVMVMKEGQPVDGFAGAQPESDIRNILQKHLPAPWQKDVDAAVVMLESDDSAQVPEAIKLLRSAYTASGEMVGIALMLASTYIEINRLDDAQAIIDSIKMVDQGPEYERVVAQLELARNADKAPEITALEAELESRPDDLDVVQSLAVQYSQNHHARDALELLYRYLLKNVNAKDGELKKIYMDILAVLGMSDPLAVEFQRKIYALLY